MCAVLLRSRATKRLDLSLQTLELQAQEKDLGVRPTRGELQGVRVYDNIHAIIVGVNRYQYLPVKDWLQYAVVDARAFQQVLINEYGVPSQNITLLLDEQATRQAIREAIRDLIRSGRVGKNDLVVLFFSMHGQIVRVNGEDLGFLIPYDAQLNLEIVDERQLRATCIALDASFWQDLEKCPAKHIVVFTDACYSGAIARNPRPSQQELRVLASERAVQVIASSTRKQPSFELPSLGHGVFTYALLETLREWARENPGLPLRLTDLFTRVRSRVIELMGENKQLPVFQNRVAGGECLFIPCRIRPAGASASMPASRPPANTPVPTVRIFTGHETSAFSVAFSPKGESLASADMSGTVLVWRVLDGQILHTLKGHHGWVGCVAFSPDGQLIASAGSEDGTVRMWQVSGGQILRILKGHEGRSVRSVAFAPNGQLIASGGGDDGTVRIWRVSDGKLLRTLPRSEYLGVVGVLSVAFSPNGQLLASGSEDGIVCIWRVSDGKLLRTLKGGTGMVSSVVFSRDGQWIVSGGGDQIVRVWRASDGQLRRTMRGQELHGSQWTVLSVAISPNGQLIASGDDARTVRVWRFADGKLLRTFEYTGQGLGVFSVAFSPDGQWLASANSDGIIRLWRLTGAR